MKTLLELSNELVEKGYPDLFDYQVDGEILDIDTMTGSVAYPNGDNIVEFKIIKLDEEDGFLNTIVEVI